MMTRYFPLALAPLLLLAACDRGPSFERTNASTDAAINEAAANIAEGAGTSADRAEAAREATGQQVRAAAAGPPPR